MQSLKREASEVMQNWLALSLSSHLSVSHTATEAVHRDAKGNSARKTSCLVSVLQSRACILLNQEFTRSAGAEEVWEDSWKKADCSEGAELSKNGPALIPSVFVPNMYEEDERIERIFAFLSFKI